MVFIDPRGGHNRKRFNENFFKTWSSPMAYVLGLIMADGAIENVIKSSRTCYLQITSGDFNLLSQVKDTLSSQHKIYTKKAKYTQFSKKIYLCKELYVLRIGSKATYNDLEQLGVASKKSRRLRLPPIPETFFMPFLRGYFDGDGCFGFYRRKSSNSFRPTVIFTSGCRQYLKNLSTRIQQHLLIAAKVVSSKGNSYQLIYSCQKALTLMDSLYKNLNSAPYLTRKYEKYNQFKKVCIN